MSKRRLNNEGSISYNKSKELWVATIFDAEGGRIFRYGKTKQIVRDKLKALQNKKDLGSKLIEASMFLRDYLPEWLEIHKNTLRQSTYAGYEVITRVHLIPRLGKYKLNAITPEIITRTWNTMLKQGHSPTVINHCQRRLSKALNDAIRRSLIDRNPCEHATVPKIQEEEVRPFSNDQVVDILSKAKGAEYYSIIFTGIGTGMRRGELCALQWKDINWNEGLIQVNRNMYRAKGATYITPPKTHWGRRTIDLNAQLIQCLKDELQKQMDNGIYHGYSVDQDSHMFRYTTKDNSVMFPSAVSHGFKKLLIELASDKTVIENGKEIRVGGDKALLKNKFHDLRHTHATTLLKMGIHPKVVQERLGHSSVSVTLDIYSHLIPSIQKEAIKDFEIPVSKEKVR